jgi:hypothetical protein
MKTITLEQAKNLTIGTILYHIEDKNADGSARRWRVAGKVKTWKRNPEKVKVPVKRGLRSYDYLTEDTLNLVTLTEH